VVLLATPPAGAGFPLAHQIHGHLHVQLPSGWEVDIAAGTQTILAYGPNATGYEDARDLGLEAAQQGLDVLSISGTAALNVLNMEGSHFAWWPNGSDVVLRLVGLSDWNVGVSATASVTNAAGQTTATPQPPVVWHPSFRYFRLSQTTTDLLDAYRNLYLGVESVLSTIVPVGVQSNGRPERESTWLRRGLRTVHAVSSLAGYAPPGSTDPPKDIYQDVYANNRTAIFHAKQGRTTLLPHGAWDRNAVQASFERLTRLYLDLVNMAFGVRRGGGVMTYNGFEMLMRPRVAAASEMAVSDDSTLAGNSDTAVNPADGAIAYFHAAHVPALDRPGAKYWIGEVPTAQLRAVPEIRRAGLILNSELVQIERLTDPLSLSGIDVFQLQLGWRLVNTNSPRAHFPT
jgi:hypothetical protein